MAENDYILAFSVCSVIGPKKFASLMNMFGSAEKAWGASKEDYEKLDIKLKTYNSFDTFRKSFDIQNYLLKLKKTDVEFISKIDKRYPKKLLQLESPPIGLFAKGNASLLKNSFSIGVVGTRKITSYGRDATVMLSGNLSTHGICIVSGLALGVDGIAHRAALENKGNVIAVLACGVDCCRPSENYSLYQDILRNNGLIISEYALGVSPQKGTFLARNRIIAALSDGVLVTEAATGSGSLVTAHEALKLGKKVFAVPGPITSRMSDGTTELLKRGAKLVSGLEDILEELKGEKSPLRQVFEGKAKFENLNIDEKKIVKLLENEGMTIDEISKKTKLQISILFTIVSSLELKGIIKNSGGKISISI